MNTITIAGNTSYVYNIGPFIQWGDFAMRDAYTILDIIKQPAHTTVKVNEIDRTTGKYQLIITPDTNYSGNPGDFIFQISKHDNSFWDPNNKTSLAYYDLNINVMPPTTYTFAANQTATVSNSGATINIANNDIITASGDIFKVAAGATDTIIGTGNTINLTNNDKITASGNTFNIGANLTETIIGDGNTINGAKGDTLTVNGSGNTISTSNASIILASGVTDTVNPNGISNTITLNNGATVFASGDWVNLGAGVSGTVLGGGDTITLADGDTITVGGNGQNGWIDAINLNSGTIFGKTGSNLLINGTKNTINATNSTFSVLANDTETFIGTGNTINLTNNDKITASGNTFNIGANLTETIIGDGNTINGAKGDTLTVNGSGNTISTSNASIILASGVTDTVNPNGISNTITLNNGATVFASGDWVNLGAGVSGTVLGGGDTITLADGDTITVGGNGQNGWIDAINLNSGTIFGKTGSNLLINGTKNTISATNSTFSVLANDTETFIGSGNTINLASQDNITVNGTKNDIWTNGSSQDNITVNGTKNEIHINGSNNIINSGGNNNYNLYGDFQHTIINNAATGSNSTPNGGIYIGATNNPNQLWFEKVGNNLHINLLGTHRDITIAGWYSNAGAEISNFYTASVDDGIKLGLYNLSYSHVTSLVQGMATYRSQNSAFDPFTTTQMPSNQALQSVINTAWSFSPFGSVLV